MSIPGSLPGFRNQLPNEVIENLAIGEPANHHAREDIMRVAEHDPSLSAQSGKIESLFFNCRRKSQPMSFDCNCENGIAGVDRRNCDRTKTLHESFIAAV